MSETSKIDPLGGADEDPGVPTTYVGDIDDAPLGGAVGDPAVPTTYIRDIDGGPPGRHYQRSGSAHHLTQNTSHGGPPGRRCRTSRRAHH
jgi:hypothetical protein